MRFAPILMLSLSLPVFSTLVSPAFGAGQEGAKFALHVKAVTSKGACTTWAPTNIPCSNYITAAYVGVSTNIYLVVAQADQTLGIAGLSCGVAYGSNVQASWSRCSDLEFPCRGWPAPGGGNRITWAPQTHCQRALVPGFEDQGVHAVAGYFTTYAYGQDELSITQNFCVPTPEQTVSDCSGQESILPAGATGSVRFTSGGGNGGTNPCGEPAPPFEWPQSSVLLHINNIISGDVCRAQPTDPEQVVTTAPVDADGNADYYVLLLATPVYSQGVASLSGMQVGIDYQAAGPQEGLRVWAWYSCGFLQTPTEGWPADGTGNTISWSTSSCRRDALVNAGYFYVTAYSPEIMAVTGHPATGQVAVADCEGTEVELDHVIPLPRIGWVSFGGAASGQDTDGCNPAVESCEQPIPVIAATWGAIKAKY